MWIGRGYSVNSVQCNKSNLDFICLILWFYILRWTNTANISLRQPYISDIVKILLMLVQANLHEKFNYFNSSIRRRRGRVFVHRQLFGLVGERFTLEQYCFLCERFNADIQQKDVRWSMNSYYPIDFERFSQCSVVDGGLFAIALWEPWNWNANQNCESLCTGTLKKAHYGRSLPWVYGRPRRNLWQNCVWIRHILFALLHIVIHSS